MTIDIVQADYDVLEAIAGRFAQQSEASQTMHDAVRRSMQALQNGGWEGEGSRAFFAEMEGDIFPAVTRLTEALSEAQRVTLQVKEILQTAEEEASNPFRAHDNTHDHAKDSSSLKISFHLKIDLPDIGGAIDRLIDEGKEFVDDMEQAAHQFVDFLQDSAEKIEHTIESTVDNVVTELFKMGYDHELPKSLIDHYSHGNGEAINLTANQMKELGVDVRLPNGENFNNHLQELAAQGGGTQHIVFSDLAGAQTHGTLGTFTINYDGNLTVNVDNNGHITSWSFDGNMDFADRWDFNPQPWGERPTYGEVLTRIGDQFLPGEPFDITSDSVPVSQSNIDVEADWIGIDTAGTPSRLANEINEAGNE